ncbi:MAG: trypsin-like peptidase domain-containing protein [Planctomycetes bacterium]|nr:trypsin-like peptidase domain-containing protein [Planctomycetota bacterium]
MLSLLLPLVVATATALPLAAPPAADLRDSVVKIHVTVRAPDAIRPWSKQQPAEQSGSGVLLAGGRILTNAHVVRYSTQVRVQPNQSSEKLNAKVRAISVGMDLALLELDEPDALAERPVATLAAVRPAVGAKVAAFGFPIGGDTLSVTEGSISRIEYAPYNDGEGGLRIQVDAAINPGNSGGPAAVGGEVIGLCFSGIRGADNIGYVIPNEEVTAFLADAEDGRVDGKPRLDLRLQTLENPALRAKLALDKATTGLLLTGAPAPSLAAVLEPWDLLAKIGPHAIDNDGMVAGADGLRLSWQYWIAPLAKEGKVAATIVRRGQPLEVALPVAPQGVELLPPLQNRYPSYFVWGPCAFSPVYADYAAGIVRGVLGTKHPLVERLGDDVAFAGEQLVMLCSPLLPHQLSKGYDAGPFSVVGSVNGIAVKNLAHLVELLRDCTDDYVVIEFADHGTETLVFKRAEVAAAQDEILEDNGIRNPCSADLEKVWKKE